LNYRLIAKSLGILLVSEALLMLPSYLAGLYYGEASAVVFLQVMLLLIAIGLPMYLIKTPDDVMYARDGFMIVSLGWILISLFGALPFMLSKSIPSFVDSFFESSSGFTTTGASILTDVEIMPKGMLFWRSFTHWIGGMGVLTFTLAILPSVGAKTLHIMKAESPGPAPGKIVPKIGQTAKILYGIYLVITIIEVLLLVVFGMPFFDSLLNTFGTVGTGGFSIKNASIGAYNNVFADIIITVFMLASGVNFALYYQMMKGKAGSLFKNEEFKFYMGMVFTSIALIALNTWGSVFKSIWESIRHSSFQVASIITTTGYATNNFDKWPMFSKAILFILMFTGCSAGSTGGGIKSIRILLLVRVLKKEITKVIHPSAVQPVKFNGKIVEDETLTGVLTFFFMYMLIFILAVVVVALDGKDFATTFSSVAATIGNIGPGFGAVGPVGNYSGLSSLSKVVLSVCMIIGRLEILPILLLFAPTTWKKVNI
jgi:trk system potassium uptake protein TrkH